MAAVSNAKIRSKWVRTHARSKTICYVQEKEIFERRKKKSPVTAETQRERNEPTAAQLTPDGRCITITNTAPTASAVLPFTAAEIN